MIDQISLWQIDSKLINVYIYIVYILYMLYNI